MDRRARDPGHAILPEAWKHEVVGFEYDGLAEEPYLDLVLRHAESGAIRRLRFLSPCEIRIGQPWMNSGLAIRDVRRRQMDGIGVEVYSFENGDAAVTLLAREVVDVTGP